MFTQCTRAYIALACCAVLLFGTPAFACDCTNSATSETSTETVAIETETVAAVDLSSLSISELYPEPLDGEEEFIEIYNSGTTELDISTLVIRDAAGHSFTPDAGTTLAAGAYVVFTESLTHIALNNSGDTVELLDASGAILCSVTYESSEKGLSWQNMLDATFAWSTPTPSAAPLENIENAEAEESAATPTSNAVESESSEAATESADSSAVASDAESTNTETVGTTSTTIILSELLPNPATSDTTDEWIEIQNIGQESVTLRNWQLTDTVRTFTIPEQTLAPEEYALLSIEDTSISLNNTGDTVYLIDGLGAIVQGTTYENATSGESWSYAAGSWTWSTPTPGDDNVVVVATEDVATSSSTETATTSIAATTSEQEPAVDISTLRTHDVGFDATITGVVSVEPGVFGDQYFYIQDAHAGIQIYSYSKQFPDLSIGDTVRVTGTLSSTRNELRFKISSAQDCVVVSHGTAPQPIDVAALAEEYEGMLVHIEGTITDSASTKILLDDGTILGIKAGAQINTKQYEDGASIQAVGIVIQYDDEYKLLPRSEEDIAVDSGEASQNLLGNTAQAATGTEYHLAASTQSQFPWSILFLGVGATLSMLALARRLAPGLRTLIMTHSTQQQSLPSVETIHFENDESIKPHE